MNHDLANEIRSKVDIVDIIGERIPLVAKGKNFFGVCPFHDDTNPSMSVSREKQIYTCFSCHATGNVYTFLMNYEHIDFKEALKYLGDKVGIDTKSIKVNKKETKFDKLYDAYNFSLKYYQNILNSTYGKTAKKYLLNRKIDEKLIKEFEIGLSSDKKDDLTKLLASKNYDLATLNKIGLSSDNHDIYNDRIMFPLYDVSGRCVGFSGRIYKDDDTSKYVNTKETDIFKKGEMLYHYHIAREEARIKKSIILMEGFMDVIRASSIGIKNTVALMGTALTKEQINLIKRLSNNVYLCLDGDAPGIKATLSVGDELLKNSINVNVIVLPKDEDPDSYILKNGKEAFERLIESSLNYSDFKINKLKETVDFRSDRETSNYINKVLEETAKINDEIEREVILKRLAKEFDIRYNTLEMRINTFLEKKKVIQEVKTEVKKVLKKDKYLKAFEQIIYFMLNNDWVITKVEEERIIFPTPELRKLVSEITYYYQKYGNINMADFYTYAGDKEDIIKILNDINTANYDETTNEKELLDYFKVAKEYLRNEEIKRLTGLMKKEVDPLEQAKISEKIRKLRLGDN